MNKNISSYYTAELNKMAEIQSSIIEHLRNDLIIYGEQGFIYDDDTNFVPVFYIDDDDQELEVDKIKVDEEGVIKIHDEFNNEWYRLIDLDYQAINTLIEYIDWK